MKIRRCEENARGKRKLPATSSLSLSLSEKRNKICRVHGKSSENDFRIDRHWIRVSTMAQKTKRLIFPHARPRAMSSRGMSHCATLLHFDFRILNAITQMVPLTLATTLADVHVPDPREREQRDCLANCEP